MAAEIGNTALATGLDFRASVGDFLASVGVEITGLRGPGRRKLSEELADEWPNSDVKGIPDWTLSTNAGSSAAIGPALDKLRAGATLDRTRNFAAIFRRPAGRVTESFVIIPLDQFATLLRRDLERGDS